MRLFLRWVLWHQDCYVNHSTLQLKNGTVQQALKCAGVQHDGNRIQDRAENVRHLKKVVLRLGKQSTIHSVGSALSSLQVPHYLHVISPPMQNEAPAVYTPAI